VTSSPERIEAVIMDLLAQRGAGRTIDPGEVARAIGGDQPEGWAPLMRPIRHTVVRLMKEGRVVILRKGRPVDPDDFRGVYRIGLPAGDI
jgi:Protein of unknown function (DUF3253)